ncbi:MAG: hypothetical protein K9M99_12430 [Candidatus Cloacimonetes bacterium]|nr:hypothetical protein [Candidatus Cloacimonadota bacterium]
MKKRQITFPEQGILRKHYQKIEDAERERQIYNLQLSFMPKLLKQGRDEAGEYNDFEYLSCRNLWQKKDIDFGAVARLYSKLHSQQKKNDKVICQIDTSPQNIIYVDSSDSYFFIDFVDWRLEYAEFDLIHFLLFWAAVKEKQHYIQLQNDFVTGYIAERCIDTERWRKLVPKVIEFFDQRRQHYGKYEKNICPDKHFNRKYLAGSGLISEGNQLHLELE